MKKIDISYLAVWGGIPVAVAAALVAVGFTVFMENKTVFGILVFAAIGLVVAVPMFLESKMKKKAAALEPDLKAQGFTYQYKFEASDAVYYIDQGGRMGVIYRYNPELQFVDLNKVTNVHVNDGKFGMATSRVSCEFLLDGKKVRITTLQVSRGTLSMKDKRVLEAISKADQLCDMLESAKANAKA